MVVAQQEKQKSQEQLIAPEDDAASTTALPYAPLIIELVEPLALAVAAQELQALPIREFALLRKLVRI